jgi:hypothetical protein
MESKSTVPYLLFYGSYPTVVGEKLNWRVAHPAGSSSDVHRFTGHETCLRRNEALTINKESSPLKVFNICFTAVSTLLGTSTIYRKQQGCPQVYWV